MDPALESIWTHWHGHPDALIGLAIVQGAYLLGVGPLRERYGLADKVEPRQIATFTAGMAVIFISLLSPIHFLSDNYLFSMHMVQHVLLTLVAPPLLILGTPDWLIRPLLRPNLAFRAARLAVHPIIAFALFNFIFSVWHIPTLYATSLNNHAVHIGEHLLFMGTAVIMWWPIVSMMPELPRLPYPIQMGYLFLLSVAQIIVFALLTFANEPLYEFYVNAPRIWGISPLLDQQLGAIIMKIGAGTLFLTLFIVIFFRWFKHEEEVNRIEFPEREHSEY
ncbi:MAG: cytochrome c oxidase assembly protein [Chloroflexi bacterium]|nr:cytochrome c oxidase assembly protein [Chloroflexota bacterium]